MKTFRQRWLDYWRNLMCTRNLYLMLVSQVGRITSCGGTHSNHDLAVVTTNAQDFIELLDVPMHPGLIVLRESGLSRQEQWERLRPVVRQVKKSGDDDFLLNKLIEISGVGRFEVREMPEP